VWASEGFDREDTWWSEGAAAEGYLSSTAGTSGGVGTLGENEQAMGRGKDVRGDLQLNTSASSHGARVANDND